MMSQFVDAPLPLGNIILYVVMVMVMVMVVVIVIVTVVVMVMYGFQLCGVTPIGCG
jgi:hypothetical protein